MKQKTECDVEIGNYISSYSLFKQHFVGEVLSIDDTHKEIIIQIIDISIATQPIKTTNKRILPFGNYKVICNPYNTAKNILKNRELEQFIMKCKVI